MASPWHTYDLMAVSLSCAVLGSLTPPVGIRPRSSTAVWAMVMGENEEVVCGLWCVGCDLRCVLSNPDPPIEFAQLGVCALGEPSYTVELSHVLPAVPLSRVVGHPSRLSCCVVVD